MTAILSQLETSYHDKLHYLPSPPNTAPMSPMGQGSDTAPAGVCVATSTLTLGFLCAGKGLVPEPLVPNRADMEMHLALLFDWTQTHYPDGLFEVRCILPNRRGERDKRFPCTQQGYREAVFYAVEKNVEGYNVYVCVNPLKPGTNHTANHNDVEIAIFNYTDGDGVDDPARLIREKGKGFVPAFGVQTGTTPLPRCHTYWRMSEPITDMAARHDTQVALAMHFGTDRKVKDPSRVMRLAGSVSYPDDKKRGDGYVTELTALHVTGNGEGEVCKDSFIASFPYVEPPEAPMKPPRTPPETRERTARPNDAEEGNWPLSVIEALLADIAYPQPEDYDGWLDIGYSVKEANPNTKHIFNDWRRGEGNTYTAKDDHIFDTLKPSPNSRLGCRCSSVPNPIGGANIAARVYEWWIDRQAKRAALERPVFRRRRRPKRATGRGA